MSDYNYLCVSSSIMDNTIICSVNCEVLNRSSVFPSGVLKTYKCDFFMFHRIVAFG